MGKSKEWTTAACLGQMQLTPAQAEIAAELFDLSPEAARLLTVVPYKGSLPTPCRPTCSSTSGTSW